MWRAFQRCINSFEHPQETAEFAGILPRCTRNELIRQVEWLKTENEMLRKRVGKKQIFLEPEEKARLMKLGQGIGAGLKHFISFISYQTFLSWLRKTREGYMPKKLGRPRTAESNRKLIVKIGSETGWGYTRIMEELKKLGLKPPSRTTRKPPAKELRFYCGTATVFTARTLTKSSAMPA